MADKDDLDEQTIAQETVVTKYKLAAQIVNKVLLLLIEKCQVGTTVLSICEAGDEMITTETTNLYKKDKTMKKGIAFPTCVSVNNCICHFSPLKSDAAIILAEGDMVKLDLGAHIAGFIAVIAHTVVVGGSKTNKVTGRKADVIRAAYFAAEAALRLVVPGGENNTVTKTIQQVAESFKCKPVEGMLSHQLKQFRIDGEKSIIQNPTDAQKKEHEKCEFSLYEVYAVDVLISSGEGKGKEKEARTTVFKKTDEMYRLKLKTSKEFFSKAEKRFGTMPFTLRSFEEETRAKMGVHECITHNLVEPFNVLFEKDGEYVAQFKFTVLLTPNGPLKITSSPMDLAMFQTTMKISDDSIKALLNISAKAAAKMKKDGPADKTETSEDGTVNNGEPVDEAATVHEKASLNTSTKGSSKKKKKPADKTATNEDGTVNNQEPVGETDTVNEKASLNTPAEGAAKKKRKRNKKTASSEDGTVNSEEPVGEAAAVNEKVVLNTSTKGASKKKKNPADKAATNEDGTVNNEEFVGEDATVNEKALPNTATKVAPKRPRKRGGKKKTARNKEGMVKNEKPVGELATVMGKVTINDKATVNED